VEFQQVVRKRRMVRAYRQDPLAPEVVQRILANGNRAPSAGCTQGYGFLVLEAAEERVRFWETIAAAGLQPDAQEMAAPLLLVVPLACKMAYLDRYAEPDKGWTDRDEARWPIPYWYIDTGFAALLMLLCSPRSTRSWAGCSSVWLHWVKGPRGRPPSPWLGRRPRRMPGGEGAHLPTGRHGRGRGANPRPCHGQRSLRTHSHRPIPGRG
jgi:nitroreductase